MTGGARVGWTNASWPLARLSADRDRLTISIRLLGTYSFVPEEVSAIERYVMIPVLGWGVRIRHCKADCPERVIFWCLGNPDTALKGIREAGFLPGATSSSTVKHRGIAPALVSDHRSRRRLEWTFPSAARGVESRRPRSAFASSIGFCTRRFHWHVQISNTSAPCSKTRARRWRDQTLLTAARVYLGVFAFHIFDSVGVWSF